MVFKCSKKRILQVACVLIALALMHYESGIITAILAAGWEKTSRTLSSAIQIFAWFSFGWMTVGLTQVFVWDVLEKRSKHPIPKLLKDIVNASIFFVVILSVLALVFSAPISGLIAGSSVLAAVVGLAVTRMISDVFSGVALGIERAYNIGDWLEIEMKTRPSGFITGKVSEINWRATRLHTKADEIVVIPNSEMARMKFVNFSLPERHYRNQVEVSLSHKIPPDRVKRILSATIISTPGILKDPAPKVTLLRFDQRGVVWSMRFWIKDFSLNRQVMKDAHETLLRHLQIAGIDISYHRVIQQNIDSYTEELSMKPVKEGLLKRIELFDVIDLEHLMMIAETMQERRYTTGEYIIRQGDEGSSLFVVAEGVVSVLARNGSGEDRWIAHIEPGRYFGEMSLLTGEPRAASARAETSIICYEITKEILLPIITEHPHLLGRLSRIMADRQLKLARVHEQDEGKPDIAVKERTSTRLLQKMQSFFGIGLHLS